jgi:hypothetical protein
MLATFENGFIRHDSGLCAVDLITPSISSHLRVTDHFERIISSGCVENGAHATFISLMGDVIEIQNLKSGFSNRLRSLG